MKVVVLGTGILRISNLENEVLYEIRCLTWTAAFLQVRLEQLCVIKLYFLF